ncbi:hypothetical protein AZI86_18535 [Bdellovibrio bacteriovorus]|uniref:Uncharacterized protein n=1 Tax=Bdellovibrio bacteriovorus TaxID=959 RepID=A0A150WFC2_BDEBC|nr:hypothetical protein AZI86_18535 [Bdellovibrio bacteriovorus]
MCPLYQKEMSVLRGRGFWRWNLAFGGASWIGAVGLEISGTPIAAPSVDIGHLFIRRDVIVKAVLFVIERAFNQTEVLRIVLLINFNDENSVLRKASLGQKEQKESR